MSKKGKITMVRLAVNFFISTVYMVLNFVMDNTIQIYILQTTLSKGNNHEWIFL